MSSSIAMFFGDDTTSSATEVTSFFAVDPEHRAEEAYDYVACCYSMTF